MPINNDGILVTPISLGDLSSATHTASLDLGTLCRSSLINKWAKNKSFRNANPVFAFDGTQATPELRSPARVAAALAANFGLNIPRFNATDFKTHYSDQWSHNIPRGLANQEWYRLLDFDGYLHECYWQLGPVTINNIQSGYYSIFDSYLSTPRTPDIYAGDLLTLSIRCAEDPDTGLPGLLYPYSFYREQQADYDLSRYYMGIAILDAQNKLWVITGDQMRAHHTRDDVDAFLTANVPNSIVTGAAKIIPVLTETAYPTWDDAPGSGHFISLNGAYLSRTIGSASSKLSLDIDVTYSNGSVTMVFTITNNTSSNVNLSNIYAYIMSAESYYNEGDSDHNPPTTGGYGVMDYIDEHWPGAAPYTPPSDHMGLSNPPDIYLSDWISGIGSPAYLAARGYNARTDFRAANNNSDTIAVGRTVTWTKTINIGTDDGCGYYADGVFVAGCMYVNMNAYTEAFAD